MADLIHVAVAVIRNPSGDVFITLRPDHVHQGGLWEFPGGKVETGESVYGALVREIHEENGIDILRAQPLIQIPYHYLRAWHTVRKGRRVNGSVRIS